MATHGGKPVEFMGKLAAANKFVPMILAALIAVLVWPKPAVSPEVEGLLTRPSVVERVMPVGSMVAGCGRCPS